MADIQKVQKIIPSSTLITFLLIFSMLFNHIILNNEWGTPLRDNEIEYDNSNEVMLSPSSLNNWFTENAGQAEDSDVEYIYTASDCQIGFIESGYFIMTTNAENLTSIMKVTFTNSNPVSPRGVDELNHRNNYFIGNDPSNWRSGVRNYEKVVYTNLFDGIDLRFYCKNEGLKYDFIVSPGANPEDISYSYDDVSHISIDADGDLHINSATGELIEQAPFSYQLKEEGLTEIPSNYELNGNDITFTVGAYNQNEVLIIDPLIYSTFIGGIDRDSSDEIAIDDEGNVYIAAFTRSTDFPTTQGSYNTTMNGNYDGVVCKLNSDGTELLYSTFIGGSGNESAYRITVDAEKCAYITGKTDSQDFPTTPGCYDDSYNGGYWELNDKGDIFVCKLSPDGNNLLYSTLIGGSFLDAPRDILIDHSGSAYVMGSTQSLNFPTQDGNWMNNYSRYWDIFLLKLNSNGSEVIHSRLIGGKHRDQGNEITFDAQQNVYLVGTTNSPEFPTTPGCYDGSFDDGQVSFVCKFSNDFTTLLYSTFIGGTKSDFLKSIAVDSENCAYVTGLTNSDDFPTTPDCLDDTLDGIEDGIFFKLNPNGTELLYSTYFGGNSTESGQRILLDSFNNVYIGGQVFSSDFPTTSGCFDDSQNGDWDVFLLLKLGHDSYDIHYSTYIGGSSAEWSGKIAIDALSNVYMAGRTSSTDFPMTSGIYDDSHNGDKDIFVLKLKLDIQLSASIKNIYLNPAMENQMVFFNGSGIPSGNRIIRFIWRSSVDGEIYNGTEYSFSTSNLSLGNHTIFLKVQDDTGNWSDEVNETLIIHEKPTAEIISITPDQALRWDDLRFEGIGSDDGTITEYAWRSSINGEFYRGDQCIFYTNVLSNGTHTIFFRVKDNYNSWSDEVSTLLNINGEPVAIIEYIHPKPGLLNQSVKLHGLGIDDGEVVRYLWSSDRDGVLYDGMEPIFSTSNLSSGDHTINLRVQDDFGIWSDEVQISYFVTLKPTAIITNISGVKILEGNSIQFTGKGIDEGTITGYAWRSSLDGEFYIGASPSVAISGLSSGNHTIYFRVQDDA